MTNMTIKSLFSQYDGARGDVIGRAEQYARYTLPYLMPIAGDAEYDMQNDYQSLGARAVNNLSNKMMMALFPPSHPFFRLTISDDARLELERAGLQPNMIDEALAKAEKKAIMDMAQFGIRTELSMVMQQLIVTGNTLLYVNTEQEYSTAYNLRDYIIKRDLSGKPILIITRDRKSVLTIPDAYMHYVPARNLTVDPFNKSNEVDLYTMIHYVGNDTYEIVQAIEENTVEETRHTQDKNHLRWIPLAWKLPRGRDYGVGLVEEYAGEFNGLSCIEEAVHTGIPVMLDIKGLVDPAGDTDIDDWNNAETGTLIHGREGDIYFPALGTKATDFQIARDLAEDHRRAISAAFLLTSNLTRDAERVTAEEIRLQAQELDTSNAGIYSRLDRDLQRPLSFIFMEGVNLDLGEDITPLVLTGVGSLSRASDRDNMLMFFQDLAMIASVPERLQERLDDEGIISFFGSAHSVDYKPLLLTQDQIDANRQRDLEFLQAQQAAEQPPQ